MATAMNTSDSAGRKVTLIADSIYNTIRISAIEKEVISNDVFNRLHNILQNSTAYLTYPSLRTSRFSHSLGCMHIAGIIFQQSIINASNKTRSSFFEAAKSTIKSAKIGSFVKEIINNYVTEDDVTINLSNCADSTGESLNDALYSFITPSSIDSEEYHVYIIMYQAVRIAALLHDLGHPPFSHMVEDAITDVYGLLESQLQDGEELNIEKQKFYDILNEIRGKERKDRKIHEIIGNDLAEYVLKEIIHNVSKYTYDNIHQLVYDTTIICQIALGILSEKENSGDFARNRNFLQSLHQIISGPLDADRLDYLERDLRSSSNRGHMSYDRLLTGFCLISSQTDQDKFEFVPSIQALSSIEEFFRKRFELYQVVLFHHRVAKTDALLTVAVFRLAMEYLDQATPDTENTTPLNLLTPNIYWLWKILDPDRKFNWDVANKYFQWDDAWLLNCLRRRYIELKATKLSPHKTLDHRANETWRSADPWKVYPILEELLTNKKKFLSLYKRPTDFKVVDQAFLQAALQDQDFSWESMVNFAKNQSLQVTKAYKEVRSYIETCEIITSDKPENIPYPFPQNIEELRISRGYFINILLKFMKGSGAWVNNTKQEFFWKAIENARRKPNTDFEEIEIIPIFKVLEPGVSGDFHISVSGQIERLDQYSRIVQELTLASNLFPPFFVVLYGHNKDFNQDDLLKMQLNLGTSLWVAFKEIVQREFAES